MSGFWAGKTAVISGGSRGLGLHLATELARQQSHLVLIGRDATHLSAQRDRLLQAGALSVDVFACDAAASAACFGGYYTRRAAAIRFASASPPRASPARPPGSRSRAP